MCDFEQVNDSWEVVIRQNKSERLLLLFCKIFKVCLTTLRHCEVKG